MGSIICYASCLGNCKIGTLVKSYGVSVMIVGLLIRLILMPFSIKATKQSQNMQKAQKDLNRLEEKYKNRTDNEAMMQRVRRCLLFIKNIILVQLVVV